MSRMRTARDEAFLDAELEAWAAGKPLPSEREFSMSAVVGNVYFLRGEITGRIKIGFSTKPWARIKSIQTGCGEALTLLATISGTVQDEAAVHKRFSRNRVCGEWFSPSPSLLAFIEALQK